METRARCWHLAKKPVQLYKYLQVSNLLSDILNSPPAYLLGETKSKVVSLLLEKSQTATEIASSLEIQISAARKHLESMQEMGLVTHEYVIKGVGRPEEGLCVDRVRARIFPESIPKCLEPYDIKDATRKGSLAGRGNA